MKRKGGGVVEDTESFWTNINSSHDWNFLLQRNFNICKINIITVSFNFVLFYFLAVFQILIFQPEYMVSLSMPLSEYEKKYSLNFFFLKVSLLLPKLFYYSTHYLASLLRRRYIYFARCFWLKLFSFSWRNGVGAFLAHNFFCYKRAAEKDEVSKISHKLQNTSLSQQGSRINGKD